MLALIRANLLSCVLGLAAAIFACIAIVQNVEIHGFLWIDGLNDKLEDCARDRNELRALAAKKDEQGKRSEGNIDKAEKGQREADKRAEKIEKAPSPGNCATPPEIMGADL